MLLTLRILSFIISFKDLFELFESQSYSWRWAGGKEKVFYCWFMFHMATAVRAGQAEARS